MEIEKSFLHVKKRTIFHYAYSLLSARGGGDGTMCVVHLVDSEVPQVVMGFRAGVWRIWKNHPQGWPLALGLARAWQAEVVWKSPGAMRKSPAAESSEQQAFWNHQSGGPHRQPGWDSEGMRLLVLSARTSPDFPAWAPCS